MSEKKIIENPRIRIVDDLKRRNIGNEKAIAGEYAGSKFTYKQTFKMFDDYKKAFISLDGLNSKPITMSVPSVISSANAVFGAMDANKIVNFAGPGFLFNYPEQYITKLGSETVFIMDVFLNEEFIQRLKTAGVKNVIITSATDYMDPIYKFVAIKKGLIKKMDFLDEYVREGKHIPQGMQFIRLEDFAKAGAKIKEDVKFPYEENRTAAYFLTGATTSMHPKGVITSEDGLTKMSMIYDELWFDFKSGDKNAVFIPIFYKTGFVHSVYAGLFRGATNVYKPKYDKDAFGKDLIDSKATVAVVAPSHVAALENAGLKDNSLSRLKYLFIGGEAVTPAQMQRFREIARRLGIKYIINGYGMTETGCLSGLSILEATTAGDVTIVPVPSVEYKIIDVETGKEVMPGELGILVVSSPCATKGYLDEEQNKKLFDKNGNIITGDIAAQEKSGRYRVYGRASDIFTNNGISYPMYIIEEEVLNNNGIAEAEVVRIKVDSTEKFAIFIVLERGKEHEKDEIIKQLSNLNVPGIEHLIGIKIFDRFATRAETGKRDALAMEEEKIGFIKYNNSTSTYHQTDILEDRTSIIYPIDSLEQNNKQGRQLIKKL